MTPNSTKLMVAFDDAPVLWDTVTGHETVIRDGSKPGAGPIAKHCVMLFDIADMNCKQPLAGCDDNAMATAVSPGGNRGAAADLDGTVRVWLVPSGRELLQLTPGSVDITSMAFSPNGETIAVASNRTGVDGTVISLFDARDGRITHRLSSPQNIRSVA